MMKMMMYLWCEDDERLWDSFFILQLHCSGYLKRGSSCCLRRHSYASDIYTYNFGLKIGSDYWFYCLPL